MSRKLSNWYRSAPGHAAVGATLLWAALPPVDWFPLAWIAPLWWVLLIRRKELNGQRCRPRVENENGNRPDSRGLFSRTKSAIARCPASFRAGYRALWMVGFIFWLAAAHYVRLPHWTTGFGWVALAFYLAFYLPVFIGLARVAVHGLQVPVIVAAPVVWTGLELARGHLLGGFTMASLGHTQYRWIELIQLSDLAGAYGVSFVVMFVAACLGRMIRNNDSPAVFWPVFPMGAVLAAALVYGHLRMTDSPTGESGVKIALIQGSIDVLLVPEPGTDKRTDEQYRRLSREAIESFGPVDLVVWPETVFVSPLLEFDDDFPPPANWPGTVEELKSAIEAETIRSQKPMTRLARELDSSLLVGVATRKQGADGVQRLNSAAFVRRSGEFVGRYDKMQLVIFGEYVPFADYLPWIGNLLESLCVAATPGETPLAFEVNGLRVAPNICFESVIPHLIRRQVNELARAGKEPDILINLTNDGWFWGSSELDMHLTCGVFRAVECRKPFLIAANTGFSAWIDADGRVLKQGKRRAKDVLITQTRVDRDRRSWYLAHGDRFAGVCLVVCGLCGLVGIFGRKRDSGTKRRTGGHVVDANPAVDGTARGP